MEKDLGKCAIENAPKVYKKGVTKVENVKDLKRYSTLILLIHL